jgi:hypothetical protein
MPGPEQILIVRNLIASRWVDFQRLTESRKVRDLAGELHGDGLTRIPKGFPASHPAAEMLKKKQWYFYLTLDPSLALTGKILVEVMKRFRAMLPFVEFINEPLLSQKKAQARSILL